MTFSRRTLSDILKNKVSCRLFHQPLHKWAKLALHGACSSNQCLRVGLLLTPAQKAPQKRSKIYRRKAILDGRKSRTANKRIMYEGKKKTL